MYSHASRDSRNSNETSERLDDEYWRIDIGRKCVRPMPPLEVSRHEDELSLEFTRRSGVEDACVQDVLDLGRDGASTIVSDRDAALSEVVSHTQNVQ